MKFSEAWLRECVKTNVDQKTLLAKLTMAGLEVDAVEPVCEVKGPYTIGRVAQLASHPNADRLRVCEVEVGEAQTISIVCGAPNVAEGERVIVARIGAVTAQGLEIKPSQIRGVDSAGMLVSAEELGLAEQSDGLWLLPKGAPVGADFLQWLGLDDMAIEVDLTPNRGDCLSVLGIAREVAVLTSAELVLPATEAWVAKHDAKCPVEVQDTAACPMYRGCLIRGVNPQAPTPLWMQERLRRAGVRPLQVLVDITNYVLLELGQPLHAFDAGKLSGAVIVRQAKAGETLVLLDEREVKLGGDTLVIADESGPIALAGVMGGAATAVSEETVDVFLECAYFTPTAILGRARQYGLHTDASQRFERGVDPELQERGLQRAVALLVEFAGGQPGPEVAVCTPSTLPQRGEIVLRHDTVRQVLDLVVSGEIIEAKLAGLGCQLKGIDGGWHVKPPSHRFDLAIEADLVEEVARLIGYDNLPAKLPALAANPLLPSETKLPQATVQRILANLGMQEVITYSFVSEDLQSLVDPDCQPLRLKNPISADMSDMRTSLWPGLLRAALYNQNRRQTQICLFEVGQVFRGSLDGSLNQGVCVGGLWCGDAVPEQWGQPRRAVDFYDLKGLLEQFWSVCGHRNIRFTPEHHPALHPGQSALIQLPGGAGWAGRVHPVIEKKLGFDDAVFVFELPLEVVTAVNLPRFQAVSRFPAVRRDLAVVVAEAVSVEAVCDLVRVASGDLLKHVTVFDVFRGGSVAEGQKSLALALTLQSAERTLDEPTVNRCITVVIEKLQKELGAVLRD
jgi:phenylalanyl-tRNA synthetase beta chain